MVALGGLVDVLKNLCRLIHGVVREGGIAQQFLHELHGVPIPNFEFLILKVSVIVPDITGDLHIFDLK